MCNIKLHLDVVLDKKDGLTSSGTYISNVQQIYSSGREACIYKCE